MILVAPRRRGRSKRSQCGDSLNHPDDAGNGADHSADRRQLRRRTRPDAPGLLTPAEGPPLLSELLHLVLAEVTTQKEASRVLAAELDLLASLAVDGTAVHRSLEEDEEDQQSHEDCVESRPEGVATQGEQQDSQDAVAPVPP